MFIISFQYSINQDIYQSLIPLAFLLFLTLFDEKIVPIIIGFLPKKYRIRSHHTQSIHLTTYEGSDTCFLQCSSAWRSKCCRIDIKSKRSIAV